MDPDVFKIILATRMGVIAIVFPQYGASIGICLDLDETGAPTLDPLTVDLSFTHCHFHIIFFPASSIACTTEYLTC